MDPNEQSRRWVNAKEKLRAAQLCFDHQLYGESLSRSYYACYQSMWAVVGGPPLGLWRHGGLINEFCRGQWTIPVLVPTALATLRRRLDTLYRLRATVDYDANPALPAEAQFGLDVVAETLQIIAHHKGWVI